MSAKSGWYPDPGGGENLYRYWDGRAWSAATSPNPTAPPPAPGLGSAPATPAGQEWTSYPYGQSGGQSGFGQGAGYPQGGGSSQAGYGQTGNGQTGYGQAGYGQAGGTGAGAAGSGSNGLGSSGQTAYAGYQAASARKRTPWGWWLGAAALLVVIVVVAAFVIRGLNNGTLGVQTPGGQGSQNACPTPVEETASPVPQPADGRVHGGPLSYPELGSPWSAPKGDNRVPFGSDVASQDVTVEQNYQPGQSWVASVLVGELQAGDGFYTPEQGAQIVVKCILGAFYGDNEVQSSVKVNQAATIDGHDAWIVESQLSFDITNLQTKGELLLVAIVANGSTAGLYYASIPNTVPQLVSPARDALKNLKVDG